jgi:hypothetical protein
MVRHGATIEVMPTRSSMKRPRVHGHARRTRLATAIHAALAAAMTRR